MLPLTMKSVFCALIIVFTAISTASSQCCDFDTTNCSWDYGLWQTTPSAYPNITDYPTFYSSQPSPGSNFMFIQDQSGNASSSTTILVSTPGTVISFDYFISTPKYSSSRFEVYFTNIVTSFTVLLENFYTYENDNWQHKEVPCNSQKSYCCGGPSELPCYGTLQIVATIDDTALIAIDNIGNCKSTPPPTPSSCCQFEDNTCSQDISLWYWSVTDPSPYNIPPNSGRYLWADVTGGYYLYPIQYHVTPSTQFSMSYYVSSIDVNIYVHFAPYTEEDSSEATATFLMTSLGYTNGVWQTIEFDCANCCGGGSCDGTLYLNVAGTTGSFVAAIDNIGRDSACNESLSCCYFDDTSLCGYTTEVQEGYQWYYYSARPPTIPPPNPSSAYVYFETANYTRTALSVRLTSPPISIVDNTTFRGSFYVRIDDSEIVTTALLVNFYNTGLGSTTQLDYLKDSEGIWKIGEFSCNSLHGNCCEGHPTCNGYIEFDAVVETDGGSVMYAMDAFEITGACAAFPGQSQKLHFTPVK